MRATYQQIKIKGRIFPISAHPSRPQGGWGPLRPAHAEAARPEGPAALGMSRVSLERR